MNAGDHLSIYWFSTVSRALCCNVKRKLWIKATRDGDRIVPV